MIIGRLRPSKPYKRKKKPTTQKSIPRSTSSAEPSTRATKPRFKNKKMALLSPLEQLPVELLQDVFLFSANAELTRCSKQLLVSLSSDHLKFEVTLQILLYQADKLDRSVRSQLLTRRFFTWEFLIRYLKFAQDKGWPISTWDYGGKAKNDNRIVREILDAFHSVDYIHTEPVDRALEVKTLSNYELDCGLTYFTKTMTLKKHKYWGITATLGQDILPALQGLKELELPEKILHGGWDDDRLRLLRLLLIFSCSVNMSESSGAEVAAEGASESLKHDDLEVLHLLLDDPININPTQEMLELAIQGSRIDPIFALLCFDRGGLDCTATKIQALLHENRRWSQKERRLVRGWLANGVEYAEDTAFSEYVENIRDIKVDRCRWL